MFLMLNQTTSASTTVPSLLMKFKVRRIRPEPIGRWKLDDPSAARGDVAVDSSGTAINGLTWIGITQARIGHSRKICRSVLS